MKRSQVSVVVLVLAGALAGCATPSAPYAEVVGERLQRADLLEEDLLIMGVDTRMTSGALTAMAGGPRMPGQPSGPAQRMEAPSLSDSVTIEPGFRVLRMASVRQGRSNRDRMATVPLNAKPCMRYRFVARHESPSSVEPWQVVLKEVEPIGECVAKFPETAPSPASPASGPR